MCLTVRQLGVLDTDECLPHHESVLRCYRRGLSQMPPVMCLPRLEWLPARRGSAETWH